MLMTSRGRRHHQSKSRKWSMVSIPFWEKASLPSKRGTATEEHILQKKKIKGPISVPELHNAEKRLIKMSQAGMDVTGKRMQNIIPFVDKDGIWKAKGRLENARQLTPPLRFPSISNTRSPTPTLSFFSCHFDPINKFGAKYLIQHCQN